MTMDVNKVKDFWESRASMSEIEDKEVTHRDVWQRWLELETIKQFLSPSDRVIDIGCGNGFTTRIIAPLVSEVVGVDYSEEMIRRAKAFKSDVGAERMTFSVGDVMQLNSSMFGLFDTAISERCLINLASWDDQKRAIHNIAMTLKPGGRFLFIEGSQEGRASLNRLRESIGLEAMAPVWHNIDFSETELLSYLDSYFSVEQWLHFGVYDFIARVVHPLMVAPETPQYDARINQVAANLATKMQEFKNISRVIFLVLRRKSDSRG
jgi:SAM-dependent methyltransferase